MPGGRAIVAAPDDRPPEYYGCCKKAEMLQAMQKRAGHGSIEQKRHMPGPDGDAMNEGCVGSSCAPRPRPAGCTYCQTGDTPCMSRQSPHQEAYGTCQHDQWRRDDHDDFMLDHMNGEE